MLYYLRDGLIPFAKTLLVITDIKFLFSLFISTQKSENNMSFFQWKYSCIIDYLCGMLQYQHRRKTSRHLNYHIVCKISLQTFDYLASILECANFYYDDISLLECRLVIISFSSEIGNASSIYTIN